MAKTKKSRKKSSGRQRGVVPVQLVDLRLLSSIVQQNIRDIKAGMPPLVQIGMNVNVSSGKGEQGEALVRVIATFVANSKYSEDGEAAVTVTGSYGILYLVQSIERLSKDDLNQFGQVTGLMHAWPFWREHAHSMTAKMGLPRLKMPLLVPQDLTFTEDPDMSKFVGSLSGKK